MSQSDLRLHFGLGKAQTVDVIEVKWPTTQKIERFTQSEGESDSHHPRGQWNRYPSRMANEGSKMKTLLLSKYRHLELMDAPVPSPGPDEILMRVAACGICGSDVHGYDGSSGRRIPPIVMGHEAAGTIEAVGADVTGLSEGDRVTVDSTVYCGECANCLRGDINLCDRRQVLGVSCGDYRRAGAFAEFVAVPARIVYRLPDNLPSLKPRMLEAVSVALHAVSLVPIAAGSTALVVGAGTIGLLLQQALRVAGCSRVFVADVDLDAPEAELRNSTRRKRYQRRTCSAGFGSYQRSWS
jgi:D-arabinose 1-dehydrogenase-like Zn-dependent alcohol dehydrogenase